MDFSSTHNHFKLTHLIDLRNDPTYAGVDGWTPSMAGRSRSAWRCWIRDSTSRIRSWRLHPDQASGVATGVASSFQPGCTSAS
jgi:hypothetical protein